MIRLAIAIVACTVALARADSPKLDEARRAVEAVRFDQAQRLLVEANNEGGNSPAAMRQIYELSAGTAIALGQRDVAEQYYRRWLALDPGARLAADVAPKLAEAFAAAQAYMAAHGRLGVRAERAGDQIDVIVDSDPLAMVAAAAIDGAAPVAIVRSRARLGPSGAAPRIAILDERGNRLVELDRIEPADVPAPIPAEPRPSFARRWTTWAVPSGLFLLAGAIVGGLAITEQDKVRDAIEQSGEHFYSDVAERQRAIRRNGTIGIVLASVGVVLAIPAAVLYPKGRGPWKLDRLSITVSPDAVGLAGIF